MNAPGVPLGFAQPRVGLYIADLHVIRFRALIHEGWRRDRQARSKMSCCVAVYSAVDLSSCSEPGHWMCATAPPREATVSVATWYNWAYIHVV